jgi:multicomponent Na+:H+ antiporter subunit D
MNLDPNILAAPTAVPLLTAAIMLAVSRWGRGRSLPLQQWLTGIALSVNLLVALLILAHTLQGERLVLQEAAWPAPYGITIIADSLSGIMLVVSAILALCLFPYAISTLDFHRARLGFYPLLLFLVMGVNGAFLSGDLFNLYVFIEVLLMASFVLMTLGGTPSQINGGIRYVILNLLASLLLLTAAGVAYGSLGTLNFAQMAQRLDVAPDSIRWLLAGLIFVAFGSKAAVFPLFFWLPASYHTPHPVVTALFGGLLTKVGVYTLFRLFPLLFPDLLFTWRTALFVIAGLTMTVGVLGAFAQPTIRRLLSFHIISQVGYMIMGLALATADSSFGAGFALAAAIIFMVHNMLVKTALMMGGGAVELEMGSGNLSSIGGLSSRYPWLAAIFFVAAFSLAGIPPSSGFGGKLSLLQVTLDTRYFWIAGVSVFVSLLTTMSMIRIWQYSFWGKYPGTRATAPPLQDTRRRRLILIPTATLVALSLAIGIFYGPMLRVATTAANQALDRTGYIQAVAPLDEVPPPEITLAE